MITFSQIRRSFASCDGLRTRRRKDIRVYLGCVVCMHSSLASSQVLPSPHRHTKVERVLLLQTASSGKLGGAWEQGTVDCTCTNKLKFWASFQTKYGIYFRKLSLEGSRPLNNWLTDFDLKVLRCGCVALHTCIACVCLHVCNVCNVTFSGVRLVSVPDPKPIPSTNRFQYHVLYWKRYTHWMRSEDKTRVKLRVIVSQATIHSFVQPNYSLRFNL